MFSMYLAKESTKPVTQLERRKRDKATRRTARAFLNLDVMERIISPFTRKAKPIGASRFQAMKTGWKGLSSILCQNVST